MLAAQLLKKVQYSTKATDVFTHLSYKKEYLNYIKQLHPDICRMDGATEAVEKLNTYRKHMEVLHTVTDDAGTLHNQGNQTFIQRGEPALLRQSWENYQQLMQFSDEASLHFRKYLPVSMNLSGDMLVSTTSHQAVPLTHLTLPQEHVSWVVSRMLELVGWLHQIGFTHAGINPDSIAVLPETHGIVCLSFYHMKPMNHRLESISARYLDWYPQITFDQKQALGYIDLCLLQRTGLYLLGDKSGNGVKLKALHDDRLIDFLITPHYEAYDTYHVYRKLLRSIFGKPTFHELNI